MRRFVVALLGATILSVTAVQAADMAVKAPVRAPAVLPYNWTGFYIGGDIGAGWGRHNRTIPSSGFTNSYNSSGIIGGVHGGYNWQMQAIVVGLEADINATGIKGDDGGTGGTLDSTKLKWLGSVRGRIGYAFDRFLVFGTGGWAFGGLEHFNNAGAGETFTKNRSGWTLGGGVEYGLTPNWTVRADYRYVDLGTYSNGAPTNGVAPYEVSNKFNIVTVGFSYKF
ncbi:MAG: outer membrane protein [Pseudolabrys sp.]